jgi:hypothetical protein
MDDKPTDPELPVFTESELVWYKLQATAIAASHLGIRAFPMTEEDLRSAIQAIAQDVLPLLDTWHSAYSQYCKSAQQNTPDKWDRERDAQTARRGLINRLKISN